MGSDFLAEVSGMGNKRHASTQAFRDLELTEKIVANSRVGITAYRFSGKCILANQAAADLIGATREQVLSQDFRQIRSWRETGLFDRAQEALSTGEERTSEIETTSTFGKQVSLRCRFVPFQFQGEKHLMLMYEDITQRRQAERRLRSKEKQLQSLASELAITEERERRRLAADLHDSVAQTLAISKLKIEQLQEDDFSGSLAREVDEVRQFLEQVIEQTRSLIFDLSPPELYQLGLVAAVGSLVERLEKQHGIRVEFADDDQVKPLNEDLIAFLFRAVQELLINIVKHAQTQDASVSISRNADEVRIAVTDAGIGFDISEIDSLLERRGKFGLFSIRERLTHLGGRFEINSKPGRGTHLVLTAPI
jgi:PAS domain S-box-containing protein